MHPILTSAAVLLLAAPQVDPQSIPQDEPMDWTGVLDEESFAALHKLTDAEAPDLSGKAVTVAGMDCYLTEPAAGDPVGAVIVIHEWWGLNDHVKHWADRLASDGYTALAVDLYGGTVATTREEAMGAMRAVDGDAALKKLLAAHGYLSGGEIQAERVASIGWCFGGGWSLKLAMAEPDLDAAVMYYGRLVTDAEALSGIEAPVLGVFGNEDRGIPPEEVAKFKAAMESAGKSITLRQYDAAHAFANPSSAAYDTEHATEAWKETRGFLAQAFFPGSGEGLVSQKGRELVVPELEGWTAAKVGDFSAAAFEVEGGAKCTVTFLPGGGGGVLANLNRWRMQMGQGELTQDEVDELPLLPVMGTLASTMLAEGSYTPMGGEKVDDAALVGTIAPLDGETAFIKLIGPKAAVEAAIPQFHALCRSMR